MPARAERGRDRLTAIVGGVTFFEVHPASKIRSQNLIIINNKQKHYLWFTVLLGITIIIIMCIRTSLYKWEKT